MEKIEKNLGMDREELEMLFWSLDHMTRYVNDESEITEEQKNLIQTMLVDKLTDDELFDLNGQMVRRYSHYADLKREHDNGAQ